MTGSPAVFEGDPATYTVALSGTLQAGEMTSVQIAIGDIETGSGDYDSSSTAVADAVAAYNADVASSGSLAWDGVNLTFTSDGSGPMSGLDIDLGTVDDTLVEGDERLNVLLSNPSSTTGLTPSISSTQGVVTTTIVDDDVTTWNIVGDATVAEGAIAQYRVLLGGTLQAGEDATIDLTLSDVDTTSTDYASFVAAVNAAVAGRSDLDFDGTTLTYTSDGTPMADLVIELLAIDDLL